MPKKKNKSKPWKPKHSLRENLSRHLPLVASEYFEAGRGAMKRGTSWEDMHAFRLQTKRFRYTLEVFRDAYGPALERRIDMLKKLQTFLGDINDCVVTSEMLANETGMEAVRQQLERRADDKTAKLRLYWARVLDAPGQALLWTRYLGRFACRPRRRKPVVKPGVVH